MAVSNNLMNSSNIAPMHVKDEVLEKVMLGQDLSGLNAHEKINYMGNLCKSLGLNPYTKPFEILKFNGKEVPYARKDCAEQLRKINNVSITKLDTTVVEGGIYVVTAYAERSGGIKDTSTGAISIAGLKGEALQNAIMKAETKAKRRVTLSICGLGFLDETEIESMPNVQSVKVLETIDKEHDIDQDILDISWAINLEELQNIYKESYKYWMKRKDKESLDILMKAKDKRKLELDANVLNVNLETGEITK